MCSTQNKVALVEKIFIELRKIEEKEFVAHLQPTEEVAFNLRVLPSVSIIVEKSTVPF